MTRSPATERKARTAILGAFAMSVFALSACLPLEEYGKRGPGYDADVTTAPTGEKPQSKVWFHDGFWWGVLFDRKDESYSIFRLDPEGSDWMNTGVLVDERNSSKADVLASEDSLYVVSAKTKPVPGEADGTFVKRYSYNAKAGEYVPDRGFPQKVGPGVLESVVLDRDAAGTLWVTFVRNGKVYVNRSVNGDKEWGEPFVLPVAGGETSPDDISSIVAFGSEIGVMWSNQNEEAVYFATREAGDTDDKWEREIVVRGAGYVDDHLSLKSTSRGEVFVATKTSLDDGENPDPEDPLVSVLRRDTKGDWQPPLTFGRVRDAHTRPIVSVDETGGRLHVFATAPVEGGRIYKKSIPLAGGTFPKGLGKPLIGSWRSPYTNNATSTKQADVPESGLLILAADDKSKRYLHATVRP